MYRYFEVNVTKTKYLYLKWSYLYSKASIYYYRASTKLLLTLSVCWKRSIENTHCKQHWFKSLSRTVREVQTSLNYASESVMDDTDTEEIINYSFTSKRRKMDVYRAQIELKTIHLVANYEQYLFTDISNDWTVCLNMVLI